MPAYAAKTLLTGTDYSLEHLDFFSLPAMFGREHRLAKWLERFLRRRIGVLEMNEAAI